MVLHGLNKQSSVEGLLKNPMIATPISGQWLQRSETTCELMSADFSTLITAIASTTKIRFGTCQPLNSRLQNSSSSPSHKPGDATTHAATSSFRRADARPNTTA